MQGARQLTPDERRVNLDMYKDDQSIDAIEIAVGRVRGTVHNFLKNPEKLQNGGRCGPQRTVGLFAFQKMMRHARKGPTRARVVKTFSDCPLSVGRVRHYMSVDLPHAYRRMKRAPALTSQQSERNINWVTERLTNTFEEWSNIMWSDEKNVRGCRIP